MYQAGLSAIQVEKENVDRRGLTLHANGTSVFFICIYIHSE
jgi:hypothetical protein